MTPEQRDNFHEKPCACGALIPRTHRRGRPAAKCVRCREGLTPGQSRYVPALKVKHRTLGHPREQLEVSTWEMLVVAGLAGDVCEHIVKTQPVPVALLRALATA